MFQIFGGSKVQVQLTGHSETKSLIQFIRVCLYSYFFFFFFFWITYDYPRRCSEIPGTCFVGNLHGGISREILNAIIFRSQISSKSFKRLKPTSATESELHHYLCLSICTCSWVV